MSEKINGHMKIRGFVWALYVERNFIEHFDSFESAMAFANKYYKDNAKFVKPVVYFSFEAEE